MSRHLLLKLLMANIYTTQRAAEILHSTKAVEEEEQEEEVLKEEEGVTGTFDQNWLV